MIRYYIKETRTWWDKRYKDYEEVIYHGLRRRTSVTPITSKQISGLYVFTTKEQALKNLARLQREIHYGNFNSEWEIICEDIQ